MGVSRADLPAIVVNSAPEREEGRPLRVAHFIQRYPPALGGSEAYFARLSRYHAVHGDRVTVFTTNALDLEAFWRLSARTLPAGVTHEQGVEVRRYSLLRWPGRRWLLKPLSLLPWRAWQCLTLPCNPIAPRMWADAGRRERQFDVVHASAFPYAFPIACALRLARRQGIPFLLTPFLHTGDPDAPADPTRRAYTQPALRHLLHAADAIFVQTEPEHAAIRNLGVPEAKLIRQGLGVDVADCTGGDRAGARQRWQVAHNDVVIGHLANLSEEKGSVDLLHAAAAAWQRGERFTVVLAGPAMPNFRRMWDSYPWRERVQCLGVLSHEEKRDFFAGIDVFALPSRSDSFGLVLLEAWANGVPNVGYRAGGVAGVIRDGADGLLVQCGAIPALTDALTALVRDPAKRQALGRSGQERTAREYQWEDKLARVREVAAALTPLATASGERGRG